MPIKSMLGALAFVVAAIAGALWIVDAMPATRGERADAVPRVVGSARPEGLSPGRMESPAPEESVPLAQIARAETAPEPERDLLDGEPLPVGEPVDPVDPTLGRISEPDPHASEEAPAPRDAGAFAGAAVAALCRSAGSACGSSAECCPGLACAGGVAGYGTPGRCEGDTAR